MKCYRPKCMVRSPLGIERLRRAPGLLKALLAPLFVTLLLTAIPFGAGAGVAGVASAAGGETGNVSPPTYVSVADAWALAEAHHPSVIEAQGRLTSLQRDVLQREAAYSPSVTVSGTGLTWRVDHDGALQQPNPGASVSAALKLPSGIALSASLRSTAASDALRGNVSVSYPVFRMPSLDSDAMALRQAEAAFVAAQREFEQLRDEVRAEVLAALHGEQVAVIRADLARDAYVGAQQAWETIRRRVEVGSAAKTELIGAQVDLLRAEQEQISAARAWRTRQRQLHDLLGLEDDGRTYRFEGVLGWTALPVPGDADVALSRAVEHSVNVWERIEAEETARLQLQAEQERSRLDTKVSGGYVTRNPGSSDQTPGWSIGIEVSYALADGGQRRMALESREEAYERAQDARDAAERDVRDQVQEAFFQLEDASRDVEIARLELSRAQLELAAVERQAELPVATASEQAVQQSLRAVIRAELTWREAVQRYQARWIAVQRWQGAVDWTQLVTEGEGE